MRELFLEMLITNYKINPDNGKIPVLTKRRHVQCIKWEGGEGVGDIPVANLLFQIYAGVEKSNAEWKKAISRLSFGYMYLVLR